MQDAFRLTGRSIVVTGAGSGIGRSVAVACAAFGANVCLAGRNAQSLTETAALIEAGGQGRSLVVSTDITRPADLARMYEQARDQFGPLYGVVANAGLITPSGPIHEVDPEDWKRVIEVNLTGTFLTVSMAAKILVEQGLGGSILATGSSTAIRVGPGMSAYVASKGGIHALMQSVALELGPHRIRVNTLVPGQTDTAPLRAIPGFLDRAAAALPLGAVADPDELGRYAAFVLSDAVPHMTGALLKVDSGRTIS